jgi:hypothetical protein
MAINATWHKANKMPKNPTEEQRLKWHIEHMANCTCRLPSPKLMEEIREFSKNVVQ